MEKKGVVLGVFIGIFVILSVISVNAGWFDKVFQYGKERGEFEGELLEAHPANLSIMNDPPQVCNVIPYSGNPIGSIIEDDGITGSRRTSLTAFNISMYDPNGVGDLPGVGAAINTAGYVGHSPNAGYIEASRTQRGFTGADCKYVYINPTGGNDCGQAGATVVYTCNASMYYYDDPSPALWDVNVTSFNDTKGNNIVSTYYKTGIFSLQPLNGFYTSQATIEFGAVPALLNQAKEALQAVTLVNTANADFDGVSPGGIIYFNGANLTFSGGGAAIPSDNFNVHVIQTTAAGQCNTTAGGSNITLQNGVQKSFPLTTPLTLYNGDILNGNDAKRNVSFCLKSLPSSLPEGSYSTQHGGGPAWLITF